MWCGWVLGKGGWRLVKTRRSQEACQGAALAEASGGRVAVLPQGQQPSRLSGRPVLAVGDERPPWWGGLQPAGDYKRRKAG